MEDEEKLPPEEPPVLTDDDPFVYDLNATNLVPDLEPHPKGKKFLRETADLVVKNYDEEWDASKEWRDRFKDNWKIVSGFLPPKTGRFKNLANAHIPESLQNLLRQHLLLFDEGFGDFSDFMSAVPVGDIPGLEQEAKIIERHMQWQFSEQIIDFPRQMDRAVMRFLFGDVVIRSYFNEQRERNSHEVMSEDDLVTPYHRTSTAPDFSDVPWTAFKFDMYRHELEATIGVWSGVERVLEKAPPPWDTDPGSPIADETNKTMGKEAVDSKSAPYVLIQWEGWLSPPKPDDEGDQDFSRQRFMQIIVDRESRNILSLTLYEEEDWQDSVRYRRQDSERQAFIAEMEAANAEAKAYTELARQLEEQVMAGRMAPDLAEVQRTAAQTIVSQPPSPSPWMDERGGVMEGIPPLPKPMKMVPIYLKTHIVAIEPLSGVFGLGMAHIQADLNKAQNIVLSQFMDSSAMQNAMCNLMAPSVEFHEAEPEVGAGLFLKVKTMPYQSLKDAFMPIAAGQANPAMMNVLDKLHEYASNFGQASEVLTGAPGKSGEAFRGLQARMEAAQRPISTMGAKFMRGITRVLQNNARLNAVHMPEEELFHFYDQTQTKSMIPFRAERRMYERSYKWTMKATMRFETSTQQVAEADELVGMIDLHPVVQNDLAFVHGVLVNAIQARGRDDLAELLGPPPPKPTTPFGLPPPPKPGMAPLGAPGQPPGATPPPVAPPEAVPEAAQ